MWVSHVSSRLVHLKQSRVASTSGGSRDAYHWVGPVAVSELWWSYRSVRVDIPRLDAASGTQLESDAEGQGYSSDLQAQVDDGLRGSEAPGPSTLTHDAR
jgi:hypothetical protein